MSEGGTETPSQRQARLRFLLRKRSGEAARAGLHRLLMRSPSDTWSLLPLTESDERGKSLFAALRAARKTGQAVARAGLSRSEFEVELNRIMGSRPPHEVLLVALSKVEEIGLLEARLSTFAAIAPQVLEFDRDSFIMADRSLTWMVVAQRFEHANEIVSYEIEMWMLERGSVGRELVD